MLDAIETILEALIYWERTLSALIVIAVVILSTIISTMLHIDYDITFVIVFGLIFTKVWYDFITEKYK